MARNTTITFKISLLVSISVILSVLFLTTTYVITSRKRATSDILNNALSFTEITSQPIYNDYLVSTGSRFKSLLFDRMAKNSDVIQISMIGYDGRIYFDTEDLKKQTPNQASDFIDIASSPSEFKFLDNIETLKMVKSETLVHRNYTINNQEFEEIIVPIPETETSHVVSMRYLVSYNSLKQRIDEIYMQTLIIIPLCLIFIIASVLLSHTITRPINKLFFAFEKVKNGDYDFTLDSNKANSEIGKLSEIFNKMVSALKTSQEKQQEYQHTLETDVSNRTKELAQKVDELESLNKVMVGREMKMIELKKQIADLKQEIIILKEKIPKAA